jgi:hypothetical protein
MPMECQPSAIILHGKSLVPRKKKRIMFSSLEAEVACTKKGSGSRDVMSLHHATQFMVCTMSDPYAWLGAGCYHALSTTVFLELGQQCVQQFLLNLLLKSTFSPRNQDS